MTQQKPIFLNKSFKGSSRSLLRRNSTHRQLIPPQLSETAYVEGTGADGDVNYGYDSGTNEYSSGTTYYSHHDMAVSGAGSEKSSVFHSLRNKSGIGWLMSSFLGVILLAIIMMVIAAKKRRRRAEQRQLEEAQKVTATLGDDFYEDGPGKGDYYDQFEDQDSDDVSSLGDIVEQYQESPSMPVLEHESPTDISGSDKPKKKGLFGKIASKFKRGK